MSEATIDPELLELVKLLEPDNDTNTGLAKLLEKEIRRELAVYEQMDENLRKQYCMTFEEFTHSDLMKEPSFAVEQDYFDWEMATTLIKDLRVKLARIHRVLAK